MGDINWKDKCFVSTIYLVNSEKKVLLSWNKNMNTWIPVGGHIDPGEMPEEAAKREVLEETGLEFEFVHKNRIEKEGNSDIIRLHRVSIDSVPHHNKHINFVFIGKCKNSTNQETTDEQEKLKWFTSEELISLKGKMIESVRTVALEAIDLVE